MNSDDKILKGTTTIGLACSDGVVLLTDRRASMGTFIASRKAKKVYKVNDKAIELFFNTHNLFNGSQYDWDVFKNAPRWLEGGIKIEF